MIRLIKSFLVLPLLSLVSAQSKLDAFVKIIDNKDKAGETGTYRFTVDLGGESNTEIQTYFPASAVYAGDHSKAVSLCEHYFISNSQNLPNCVYDKVKNMIAFPLPTDQQPGFYIFQLGPIRNPSYSQDLNGIQVKIFDKTNNIVLKETTMGEMKVKIKPNVLTAQSVSGSSKKVAETAQYTFAFTVTNPVQASGTVEVIFPLDQFKVPTQVQNPQISINSGATWETVMVETSDTSVKLTILNQIPKNQAVMIKMSGINNPNTMELSSSFHLRTATPSGAVIDEINTGLSVQNNQAASLSVTTATFFGKTVGSGGMATFKLKLPVAYQSGGWLLITLPPTVTVGVLQCMLHIGFESDSGKCNMPMPNQIKIFDNIKQENLTFSIAGLVNPPNTKPTSNFEFREFDLKGNCIADNLQQTPSIKYTPTAGYLSSVSVTRKNPTVGTKASDSTSAVWFSFKTQNTISQGDIVQIKVPKAHFMQTPSEAVKCTVATAQGSTVNLCTISDQPSQSYFNIEFPMTCSSGTCGKKTKVDVQLTQGIKNLDWILPSSSLTSPIQITTLTSDKQYTIDSKTSGVYPAPALVEGTLSTMSLQKTPGKVWKSTEMVYEFKAPNGVPSLGAVLFEFQAETVQKDSTVVCYDPTASKNLACSAAMYPNSVYIKSIKVSDMTAVGVGSQLKIKFSGLLNPKSSKPILNQFEVKTFTKENYPIDKGVITNATDLTVNYDEIPQLALMKPLSTDTIITGDKQTFEFKVNLQHGLEATLGQLKINLPSEMSIDKDATSTSCVAYEQNTVVLLSCAITSTTQVLVSHTLAGKTFKGQNLIVKIQNGVINPPSTKPSAFFNFESSLLDAGKVQSFLVETSNTALKVTANTPNSLKNVSVTRTGGVVNKTTSLKICFETINPVLANSKLEIKLPGDQAIISNINNLKVYTPTKVLTILTHNIQEPISTLVLLLPDALEISPKQNCFSLMDNSQILAVALMNPTTTATPTSSFQLLLSTSDSFKIDAISQNIFALPNLSAGPFVQASAQFEGSKVVNEFTTVSVNVTPSAPIPADGFFFITLPDSTVYQDSVQKPQCQINTQAALNCEIKQTQDDTLGTYVSQIRIKTATHFASAHQVKLTITKVLNRFSANSSETRKLTVQSLDVKGFMINSSQLDLKLQQLTANPGAAVQSALRLTSKQVQHSTDIEIKYQSKTRLLNGAQLRVGLSKLQFDFEPISCTIDGVKTVCTNNFKPPNYWEVQLAVDCSSKPKQVCPDSTIFTINIQGFKNRRSVWQDPAKKEVYVHSFDPTLKVVDTSTVQAFGDNLVAGVGQINPSGFGLTNTYVSSVSSFWLPITLTSPQMTFAPGDLVQLDFGKVVGKPLSGPIFQFDGYITNLKAGLNGGSSYTDIKSASGSGQLDSITFVNPSITGKTMTFQIQGVRNLAQVQPLISSLSLTVLDKDKNLIAKSIAVTLEKDILKPQNLNNILVKRNSPDLNVVTDVTVSVRVKGLQLQSNSEITLKFDKKELVPASGSGDCVHQSSDTCQAEQDPNNADFVLLKIANLCAQSQASCSKGNQDWLTFTLRRVFKNPQQSETSAKSLSAIIKSGEFMVAETQPGTNLHVEPPLSVQDLKYMKIEQEGLETGQETQLNIKFRLEEAIYDFKSSFILSLPAATILYSRDLARLSDDDRKIVPKLTDRKGALCLFNKAKKQRSCQLSEKEMPSDPRFGGAPFPAYADQIIIKDVCDLIECWNTESVQTLSVRQIFNVEHKRLRRTGNMYKLSLVSSANYVMTEKSQDEQSSLKAFETYKFESERVSITRDSIKIGQRNVKYEFEFKTPSPLQFRSYFTVGIPYEQAEVKSFGSRIRCNSLSSGKRMSCQAMSFDSEYQWVRMYDLCANPSKRCEVGTTVKFEIWMNNPTVLQTDTLSGRPFIFQVFDSLQTPIAFTKIDIAGKGVYATPKIEGFVLEDMTVVRKKNVLGEKTETLKFFALSGPPNLNENTNLRIDLPKGFAYVNGDSSVGFQPNCYRLMLNGAKKVELKCSIVSSGEPAQVALSPYISIKQIVFKNVCSPQNTCVSRDTFELTVEVANPQTNVVSNESDLKLYFSQKGTRGDNDLGQAVIALKSISKLNPNVLQVITRSLVPINGGGKQKQTYCITGGWCKIELSVTNTNSLLAGSLMRVIFPPELEISSGFCSAINNGLEFSCKVSNTQTVNIDISGGAPLEAGQDTYISIVAVRVPLTTMPTQKIKAMTFESIRDKEWSVVDQTNADSAQRIQINLPSQFAKANIARFENSYANQQTNLQVLLSAPGFNLFQLLEDLPKGKTFSMILEVKFKEDHGRMDKTAAFKCKDQNRMSQKCTPTDNGFYLTIMSNSKGFSKYFTACAERLTSLKGCIFKTDTANFTNAQNKVINPNLDGKDSAEMTLYLWEGEEPDAATFTLNIHKAHKILESRKGVEVSPPIVPQSKISYITHSVESSTIPVMTGQEANFSLQFSMANPQVSGFIIEFLQPQDGNIFYFVKDQLKQPSVYLNGIEQANFLINQKDIKSKFGRDYAGIYSMLVTMDLKSMGSQSYNNNLAHYFIRGGMTMPMTTPKEFEKQLKFKITSMIIPSGKTFTNFNLQSDRYKVAAVSDNYEFKQELMPSELTSMSLFSTKPFKGEETAMTFSFSTLTAIPAFKGNEVGIRIDFNGDFKINSNKSAVFRPDKLNSQFGMTVSEAKNSSATIAYWTNSVTEIKSFLFTLEGIINPSVEEKLKFKITIQNPDTDQIYATGVMDYAVTTKMADSLQCPKNCKECTDKGVCVSCNKPSANPLLTDGGKCVGVCPDGLYQQNGKCIKCSPGCKTCTKAGGMCQTCHAGSLKIDGECRLGSTCPKDMKLDSFSGQCYRSSTWSGEPCKANNCKACGLSSKYCAICANPMNALDGQCRKDCPASFFSTSNNCYKCSPECKTCSKSATQCYSCHSKDDSLNGKTILSKTGSMCVDTCLPGDFQWQKSQFSDAQCLACGNGCNTCEGTKSNCTSCFVNKDKYSNEKLVDGSPLYLVSSGTCEASCPWFHFRDSKLHECVPRKLATITLGLPLVILIVGAVSTTVLMITSRIASKQTDKPLYLAVVMTSLFEFINKLCLFVSLWSSQSFLVFSFTGVSLLGTSLIGVFFVQLILNPMLSVIIRRQRYQQNVDFESELHVKPPARWLLRSLTGLAQMTTPYVVVGFMTAGFMGRRDLRMPLETISPMYYAYYFFQSAIGAICLTGLQLLVGICGTMSSESSPMVFGLALNSILIGIISFGLQLKIIYRFGEVTADFKRLEKEKQDFRANDLAGDEMQIGLQQAEQEQEGSGSSEEEEPEEPDVPGLGPVEGIYQDQQPVGPEVEEIELEDLPRP